MRVLVLGGDGYLGWPLAMHLATAGHDVTIADNYARRHRAEVLGREPLLPVAPLAERATIFAGETGYLIGIAIGDLTDPDIAMSMVEELRPDAIIDCTRLAEEPVAALRAARRAIHTGLDITLNMIWAMLTYVPDARFLSIGTLAEYGRPGVGMPEGWTKIGETALLFPRQPETLWLLGRAMGTDLMRHLAESHDLALSRLMLGRLYGWTTPETALNPVLNTALHYDEAFGSPIHRLAAQAVARCPLSAARQAEPLLSLGDALSAIATALTKDPVPGQVQISHHLAEIATPRALQERASGACAALGLPVTSHPAPDVPPLEIAAPFAPAQEKLTDLAFADLIETILPHREALDTAHLTVPVEEAA